MRWPGSRDYNEAVQDPSFSFKDAELLAAEVTTNAHGLPIARSGGFADVYQFHSPEGKSWAVKCFTKEISHLHRRYQAISEHLAQARETTKLPFMVDFQYLDRDLRIGAERYPVLKMTWVEGTLLHEFVRERLDDPALLETLSLIWHRLGQNLRAARIAHGDLQHGNVMLVPTAKGVIPRLIDYDGMYVPALEGTPASEIGHANYQHPGRDADRFHFEMDRFPLLLIYTAIRCLAVGGRKLWDRFDSGDNLLFKEADIKNPSGSALCRELWSLTDPAARALAGWVILASRMPIREVPLLDELIGVDGKRVPTLTAKQEAEVRRLLSPASQPMPLPDPEPLPPRKSTPVPVAKPVAPPPRMTTRAVPAPVTQAPTASLPPVANDGSKPSRLSWSSLSRIQKLVAGVAGFIGLNVLSCAFLLIKDLGKVPSTPTGASSTTAQGNREKPAVITPIPKPPEPKPPSLWRAGHVFEILVSEICSVALSADGKRAISGGLDQHLFVWDMERGQEQLQLRGHAGRVRGVAISADGKRAVSGGDDKTLRVWNLETGELLQKLEGPKNTVFGVGISADGTRAISGGDDMTVFVWDVVTGKVLHKLDGHADRVWCVAISKDGKRAASGGADNIVLVWDLETGKELRKFHGNSRGVGISGDGKRVVSGGGGADLPVFVWDLETGKELHKLLGHTNTVLAVSISVDGKRAVSGSADKSVRVWNLETGKELSQLNGHTAEVFGVAMSTDGKRVVSCGYDGTVRMWLGPDVPDVKVTPLASTPTVQINASDVALKPGETKSLNVGIVRKGYPGPLTLELTSLPPKVTAKAVLVPGGSDDAKIEITATPDAQAARAMVRVRAHSEQFVQKDPVEITVRVAPAIPILRFPPLDQSRAVISVGISADGKHGISSGSDLGYAARIWNLETGKEISELRGHVSHLNGAAISPDGTRALTACYDKTARVWDAEAGKVVYEFKGHSEEVWGTALSANGKRAITGGFDKAIKVWELERGREVYRLTQPDSATRLGITADGKRAVSISGKLVIVWDLDKGEEVYRLAGHTDIISGVSISADGKRAVSGGFDDSVRVWNLETGKIRHQLTKHACTVNDVAISADGKRFVSGDRRGNILVWDTESGTELFQLPGKTELVRSVAISADGLRVISGSEDKNVRVWDLPIGNQPVVVTPPGPNDWPMILLGKWKRTVSPKGFESFLEFTNMGKVIFSGIENGKVETFGGTYTLNGDKLEMMITRNGVELIPRYTILKLTNDELATQPSGGDITYTYKKVLPK